MDMTPARSPTRPGALHPGCGTASMPGVDAEAEAVTGGVDCTLKGGTPVLVPHFAGPLLDRGGPAEQQHGPGGMTGIGVDDADDLEVQGDTGAVLQRHPGGQALHLDRASRRVTGLREVNVRSARIRTRRRTSDRRGSGPQTVP